MPVRLRSRPLAIVAALAAALASAATLAQSAAAAAPVPRASTPASLAILGVQGRQSVPALTYSQLIDRVEQRPATIREVVFEPQTQTIAVTPARGSSYTVDYPSGESQAQFQALLERKGVRFDSKGLGGGSPVVPLLLGLLLPLLLVAGLWRVLTRRARGGGADGIGLGQAKALMESRAKRFAGGVSKTRFADVAGCDEAVEELGEVVEFLRNPRRFQALGARLPKGVLLYGPPGTGKTLLARAVAGEAGVPFFSCSGSGFVEMFVGVGAGRVRDLFAQAKQDAPCVVFIDEIDALGRQRGAGLGSGNDEREQTLNQLLVEMDGFQASGVIVIAATNRPDILDPALLRPGRFDRQITVDRPDRAGCHQILTVHSRGKPLAPEIDLDTLAAATPGFTGADLANLVNEAALLAARRHEQTIGQAELEEGIMRVVAGPAKKARLLTEQERTITAYHEMGHALVGHYLEHTDPIHKITLIPRGQALGLTISLPREERHLTRRSELMEQMAMTLGGRAAEELVFGEITTGAANDLAKVTETAKRMIMDFGMSETLGPRVLGRAQPTPLPGRGHGGADYSDELARAVDDEIRRLLEQAHQTARTVLREHVGELHRLSRILLERETIDRDQFERLLAGEQEARLFGEPPPRAPAGPKRRRERQPRPHPSGQPVPVFARPPSLASEPR